MTQTQKELLFKDICCRLPYGVKIQTDYTDIKILEGIQFPNYIGISDGYYSLDDVECKPYLFPMSSMTKEQEKDIFDNGNFYIDRRNSLCRFPKHEDDYDFVTMEDCLEIFNKFNKYHIDFRGLIPMGLAIDASGLNIY